MPTDTPTITPNWTGLEGRVLEGGYEIEKCLSAGQTSASFKVRVLGDRFTSAVAEVFAPGTIKPEQIALWKDAVQLRHANLSSPLAVGALEFGDSELPYRVLVRPDETLEGVIKQRALTPDETREVLNSLVNALQYLHGSGFAHSRISPDQVLAIGDSIRLSTGSVRRINTPLEGEENPSPAQDVFRVGATVFEVLTQKGCAAGCREEAAKLPAPFDAVVERTLDPDPQARCSLVEIRGMLSGQYVRPISKVEISKPVPVADKIAEPKVIALGMAAPSGGAHIDKAPVADIPPPQFVPSPRPLRRKRDEESRASTPVRKGVYLAAALLVAVGVLWLARPKHATQHPTVALTPVPSSTQAEKPAGTPASAWPTRAVGPRVVPNSHRAPSEASKATSAPVIKNGQVWRVVSFTYNRESDAKKKVDWINEKNPGFHAEVFSPSNRGGPYLVVLGGQMTREDASRLRQKVRASGLPRDSYIQNYNH